MAAARSTKDLMHMDKSNNDYDKEYNYGYNKHDKLVSDILHPV